MSCWSMTGSFTIPVSRAAETDLWSCATASDGMKQKSIAGPRGPRGGFFGVWLNAPWESGKIKQWGDAASLPPAAGVVGLNNMRPGSATNIECETAVKGQLV